MKKAKSSGVYATLWVHPCEHRGCDRGGAFGFGPLKHPEHVHWFCGEHRADGEASLVRA